MKKRTIFVIKSGNPTKPNSNEFTTKLSSKPPNVLNKNAGKMAGIKLIKTATKVTKKTAHDTKLVFCLRPLLNSKVSSSLKEVQF